MSPPPLNGLATHAYSYHPANETESIVRACRPRGADAGLSIPLGVQGGKKAVRPAAPEELADLKVEAPIEQWTRLGKGEKDLQTLVLQGKIKFRGSLAKLVPLQPALFRIEVVARGIPKEF